MNLVATEVVLQTERIVSSQVFAKAKRSQKLLRYLVDAAVKNPLPTSSRNTPSRPKSSIATTAMIRRSMPPCV